MLTDNRPKVCIARMTVGGHAAAEKNVIVGWCVRHSSAIVDEEGAHEVRRPSHVVDVWLDDSYIHIAVILLLLLLVLLVLFASPPSLVCFFLYFMSKVKDYDECSRVGEG